MIFTITLNPALDREMTVPKIKFDRVLRAQAVMTDVGGKGFNVSRALLALGVENTALGFIGGSVGDQLVAGLAHLGIPTDFVRVQGETRINISIVDSGHSHYIKVNEPGPYVTDREAAGLLEKIRHLVKANDWWVLSGSTPPGIQPAYIRQVIDNIQESGAMSVLDMDGMCLKDGCGANPYLIKPNAEEAGRLIGRQIDSLQEAIDALEELHGSGATRVAISLGKAGAVYSDGMHSWWAIPPQITERNPIGAGDAMLAGLVMALVRNYDGADVLRWGVACGAAAASLDGTRVGSLEMVESLLARVQVGKGRFGS
jgi:1-phosphofructokinase family hexose kinase